MDLVTGATGYVGGRLVPRLQGRPWPGSVEVVRGDVREPACVASRAGALDRSTPGAGAPT